MSLATIAHSILLRHVVYLQDGGLQRADVVQYRVVYRADAIEANAQTHHVELRTREAFDACRVADVAQDLVGESVLKYLCRRFEGLYLPPREAVEHRRVAAHQVGENRTHQHGILSAQAFHQLGHLFGREAQTVHARVQLDMDGEVRDTFFLRLAHKGVQQMEAIDLRLQLVVEHRLEGRHFGVHDEDVGRNTSLSQFRPFVGHGHGQVVYVPFLQRLGYLVGTSPIGRCLHHAHHLRLRLQLAAVVVQVGHHRAEVHLQNGFVHLPFEVFAQDVEAELARTLYQDQFLFQLQLAAGNGFEQCLCVGIESLLDAEAGSTRRDVRSYADDALHAAAVHQLGHAPIECRCVLSRLQDVGQDERALQPLGLRAPVLEVEGYVERAQVAVITIVDQQAAVLAFLHLQTHGHRLQPRHPLLDLLRRKHQVEASRQAVQRVFDGSIVDERQRKLVVHVQIAVGYQRAVVLLLHLRDEERPFGVLATPRYLSRGKQ